MKKIILASCSTIVAALIFTGCATKDLINEANEYAGQQLDNLEYNKTKNASSKIKEREVIVKETYIDLSVSKRLDDVLDELSKLNKKIYMTIDDKSNIYLPSSISSNLLNIRDFKSLKRYIEDTTNYTLEITTNKYVSNRPKIIKVIDKKALESNFSNLSFNVSSKSTVSSALFRLSKQLGFSIIYKDDLNMGSDSASENDTTSFNSSSEEIFFSNEYVYFAGSKVSDFLNYIEENFNVYTNINYEDKIISIEKYQTKSFDISALNFQVSLGDAKGISSNDSDSEGSSDGGSSDRENALQSEIEIKGVELFKANLEKFLDKDSNSAVIFNEDYGYVTIKATNESMKEIETLINEYNKKYTSQVEIDIDIYEFVLNKDFSFGTDINYNGNSLTVGTGFLEDNILKKVGTIGSSKDIELIADSKNNFIRYAKSYNFKHNYTNNIPSSITIGNNKKYIASSNTTTTSNTSTTSTTDQEIADLNEGIVITLLPRITGNKVIVRSEVKINSTNDLIAKTDKDGDTIYMPDQDIKTMPGHIVLTNGSTRIMGSYQDFQDVKNYTGAAPIEDFILGGKSGKSFVKKEIVVVISAKIIQ